MILSRERVDDFEWSCNPNVFYVFFKLLFKANYKDRRWEGIEIKRGQLVTSISNLSQELTLSVKHVRTALDKLEKSGYIGKQSGNRFSVITICNYESWICHGQAECKPIGNQESSKGQAKGNDLNKENKEKEENTNVLKKKCPETDLEQAFAELSEENAKLKEENDALKKKKAKKAEKKFVPPTIEEVDAYIKEKGYHFDAKRFVEYYEADDWHYGVGSNRKKVANWKRCCQTWEDKGKTKVPDIFDNVENSEPNVLIIDGQIYR